MTAANLYFAAVPLALAGLVLLALSALAFGISRLKKPTVSNRDSDCGDDNTLYGNVRPPETMGSGNTIVGSTDINSNKFIHCSARAGDGASALVQPFMERGK